MSWQRDIGRSVRPSVHPSVCRLIADDSQYCGSTCPRNVFRYDSRLNNVKPTTNRSGFTAASSEAASGRFHSTTNRAAPERTGAHRSAPPATELRTHVYEAQMAVRLVQDARFALCINNFQSDISTPRLSAII